jgi:hypothetical protein
MMVGRLKGLWCVVAVAVVMALATVSETAAQYYWLNPQQPNSVSLEMFKMRPQLRNGYGFVTSVLFFSANIRATENVSLVVQLPVANADWTGNYYYYSLSDGEKQTAISNPYLGLEVRPSAMNGPATPVFRLGIRPPVISDKKSLAASIGQSVTWNQAGAFTPKKFSILMSGGFDCNIKSSTSLAFNVGGTIMLPAGDNGGDRELFLDYNLALYMSDANLSLGVGLAGRLWATLEDTDIGEKTEHQLGLIGRYRAGRVQPGLSFRVPLAEGLSYVESYVYGVTCSVLF